MRTRWCGSFGVLLAGIGFLPAGETSPPAAAFMAQGQESYERGAFEDAAASWKEARRLYAHEENAAGEIDALLNLGAAYQSLGQVKLAIGSRVPRRQGALEEALDLAVKSGSRERIIAAKSSLGAACTFSRDAGKAEAYLKEALAMALEDRNVAARAAVLNNLGNLLSAQKKHAEALASYKESSALAREKGDETLAAKALVNAAFAAGRAGKPKEVVDLNEQAVREIAALKDTHEKTYMLITCGRTYQTLASTDPESAKDPEARGRLLRLAHGAYSAALRVSEAIGDRRPQSYASGYLGGLYESEKRFDEALELTRRAVFLAQETQSADALYLWQWQTGRLLRAQGRLQPARQAYERAVETLTGIRHDVAIFHGNINAGSSFREAVGPLYLELAELLIQLADGAASRDPAAAGEAQRFLVEARATVERMKAGELEDYFQEDCVNLRRPEAASVEAIAAATRKTAVVYPLPLAGKTILLVTLPAGLKRFDVAVGSEDLFAEARELRRRLETRTTHQYKRSAQRLHGWLIAPMKDSLAAAGVETLVFVPDGALRTIPFAALHDGERFLVESYAVAVTPGLTLMDPRPIPRQGVRLLTSGLSEAVQGFPALPSVPAELAKLESLYGGRQLMNAKFVTPNVEGEVGQRSFNVVHFASHGVFSADARKTFLLTYDDKLSLDGLERLIRPVQFRGGPVELLTLSACQTAAGDDRAALGLAGVAIKAGARSALATLWLVDDRAASLLMADFYTQLHASPDLSKAKALQRAQLHLLESQSYRHPCYWAPFLLIGNWL